MQTNLTKKTIELTPAEMKAAMIYETKEYENLQAMRRDYPDFRVVKIKAKKNKSDFAGLDMKTIKAYVEKHGDEDQKENFAFISKKTVDEDGEYHEAQSFFEIKKWFLNEFPEIKQGRVDYRKKVQAIYEAAEAKAEAAAAETNVTAFPEAVA